MHSKDFKQIQKYCTWCKTTKSIEDFDEYWGRGHEKGFRRSCRACLEVKSRTYTDDDRKKRNEKQKWFNDFNPEQIMLSSAKGRAKEGAFPFNIDITDIVIPEICPVLKIPLFRGSGGWSPNSPSLDKIVPELGYVKGNVRVVSNLANTMKNCGTLEQCVLLGQDAARLIASREYLSRDKVNG